MRPTFFYALALLSASQARAWSPTILSSGEPFLPDFSHAGYRWGEALPPASGTVLEAAGFGVVPDDGKDDTRALQDVLSRARAVEGPVIVDLPAGRLVLREVLRLDRGELVLRGAGSGRTLIKVPVPLEHAPGPEVERWRGQGKSHAPTSPFSWSGGFLSARPAWDYWRGGRVPAVEGKRGGVRIVTASEAAWTPGQSLQIRWHNREGPKGSLLVHVFGTPDLDFGREFWDRPDSPVVRQYATVRRVSGREFEIVEPLLHDIRPEWTVEVSPVHPLQGLGLEGFTLAFPDTAYPGHHREEGYNGIALEQTGQSWVRDVEVLNADSALLLDACQQVTVERLKVGGRGGHYTVKIGGGTGCLVRDFEFTAPSLHNPSFNTHACGSVYTRGRVTAARLDQHNGANHQNLFDDIEVLDGGDRLFDHGGSGSYRPTAGAYNVFWNLRIRSGSGALIRPRPLRDAPLARIVGLRGDGPVSLDYGPGAYIEGLNRPDLEVQSLHAYQLGRRAR